ncbi:MAG: 4Fe-4S binding protein [Verrucomicrobia bacterium]|nr:4Fe-4S binding protein [Verrucomicrobiota bacterium]MCG2680499.1 4Fe-4S binding protein [Kiritimatiellia bacterium]MBU4248222.1 4Fe-4S binding protein [Verrucomicrobiota bacterium]MBU4290425.1 4Fe-4S binding protein [Verrucomicrobiota bacterium]MBU4430168.1 4Fe-4S binding protein [Verrucomicrobiota bacterium]
MIKPGKMLREVLTSFFQKPATVLYPYVKVLMPDRFRGKIRFLATLCIGCKLCMRDCPTNCITITKVGDKRFQAEFDLDQCIYCAQCVDSCPKKALESTADYELAQLQRNKLKMIYHAEPPPPQAAAPIE